MLIVVLSDELEVDLISDGDLIHDFNSFRPVGKLCGVSDCVNHNAFRDACPLLHAIVSSCQAEVAITEDDGYFAVFEFSCGELGELRPAGPARES